MNGAVTSDGLSGFPMEWAQDVVRVALLEDLGPEPVDVTTQATIPPDQRRVAEVVARGPGVVAGVPVIDLVLAAVAETVGADLAEPEVVVDVLVDDGARVERGDVIARLSGPTQVILVAERTVLNILSRLSGVATHTRRWADALEGTGTMVLDTRKTTPGLRWLEKYAVRCGGGTNKRMGLYDVAMVKDNHVVAAGSVSAAIDAIRRTFPDVLVQVEADTTAQALEAVSAGADFLLLDNMPTPVLAETVAAVRAREGKDGVPAKVELEATGNLTLDRAREVAATGVDYLSVGALTHSAPILDLALDLLPTLPPR